MWMNAFAGNSTANKLNIGRQEFISLLLRVSYPPIWQIRVQDKVALVIAQALKTKTLFRAAVSSLHAMPEEMSGQANTCGAAAYYTAGISS